MDTNSAQTVNTWAGPLQPLASRPGLTDTGCQRDMTQDVEADLLGTAWMAAIAVMELDR